MLNSFGGTLLGAISGSGLLWITTGLTPASLLNVPRWERMRKRSRTEPKDEFQAGVAVKRLTGDMPAEQPALPKLTKSVVSQLMAEMGRKGGKKGGKACAAKMTAEQRSEAASAAARARWEATRKAS